MNNSNLAHEPPIPQGQVVHFPKNERKAMSNKEERYTKMPNMLIDSEIMAQLNDKAFKCLMFVMRQTVGFDRVSHPIAITQFQKYCGIKKRDTVMSCIRDLEQLGVDPSTLSRMKTDRKNNDLTEIETFCELLSCLGLKIVPKEYQSIDKSRVEALLVMSKSWMSRIDTVDDLFHDEISGQKEKLGY